MAKTFLTLCNDLQRESGTVSMRQPIINVANVSGRQEKIVAWIRDAWVALQTGRPEPWPWMIREYSKTLTIGQAAYDGGSTGWNLTRFSRFCIDRFNEDESYFPHALYDTTIGVADERALSQIDYRVWRQAYGRGVQRNMRPVEYALDNMGRLVVGPLPDKAYTIRGEYVASPQELAANTDVPELPGDYHDIIVYRALEMMGLHDGDAFMATRGKTRWLSIMTDLINVTAGPMAP